MKRMLRPGVKRISASPGIYDGRANTARPAA
jgi:hypothetical protein